MDIKPTDIIRSLKAHKLALDSEEQFKDGNINLSPPRQVRRSNVNDGNEKVGVASYLSHSPLAKRFIRGLYKISLETTQRLENARK